MKNLGYRMNLIALWVINTPMSKGRADTCRENGIPVGDARNMAVIRCAADNAICGK